MVLSAVKWGSSEMRVSEMRVYSLCVVRFQKLIRQNSSSQREEHDEHIFET